MHCKLQFLQNSLHSLRFDNNHPCMLLKVLRIMNSKYSRMSDHTASTNGKPSKTPVELERKLKMAKESNGRTTARSTSIDETECSGKSIDQEQNENGLEDETIRKKLAMRAYHLPGNTWRQDLGMYLKNNHLIFGICCHHRLHPVKGEAAVYVVYDSLL